MLKKLVHHLFLAPRAAVLLFSILALTFVLTSQAAERPNVLLVLFDDLGFSDLGCYGGEIPTPNLDSLGKGGLRFTQMSNSARCCPSRASLLTGLHPGQAGIPNMGGELNDQCVTLAEVLGDAGYLTYGVGKWHVGAKQAIPTARGFHEFYGYINGYAKDQWSPDLYLRLPEGRTKEIQYSEGKFYATDAFTDYAIEFLNQAAKKEKPWFLYLAHSSPHFPIQAPMESAKPMIDTYRKGWDTLRKERFARLKEIGLINHDGWKLTERSLVPVDTDAIANGYAGKQNPAWDSLPEDRREDLAHRMALYAAMVKHVDDGMGRIMEQLKKTGSFENTIIMILSDNGACYEWGPFGFDEGSRKGITHLYQGEALNSMGGIKSNMAYGSAWANLCNTPFRLYKHFTHQGGMVTPFIIHWPSGVKAPGRWVRDPAHIMDIMPTLVELANASYPKERKQNVILPMEGVSLTPTFQPGRTLPDRSLCYQHEGARAIIKKTWKLVYGKKFPTPIAWELYDLSKDPCETVDLTQQYPERVKELTAEYDAWAQRCINPQFKPKLNDTNNNKQTKPNIVFIFADDWGWGDLSCHGNQWLKTPNLDRLASEGMNFQQFNVLNPVCSPSRTAVMTGRYPARLCIHQHFADPKQNHERGMPDWLDPKAPMLPRFLKQAGYRTGHFGKWHLTNAQTLGAPTPEAYGYDEAAVFNGGKGWPKVELHDTAPNVVAFINKNKAQPFFINVWLHESHTPHVPTKESMDQFKHLDAQKQVYAAVIADGDKAVGKILAALKEAGVEQNTLVMFSSDNGPEQTGLGEKTFDPNDKTTGPYGTNYSVGETGGLRGRKRSLFEGGVRTPFLVRWPGHTPAGVKNNSIVLAAVDLLPTFCAAAGVKLPDDYQSDGENLLEAFNGKAVTRTRPIFWEWLGTKTEPDWWPRLAVRDNEWKLMMTADGKRAELYQLLTDRAEAKDVSKDHPDIVARLTKLALDWKATLPEKPNPECLTTAPDPVNGNTPKKGAKGSGVTPRVRTK